MRVDSAGVSKAVAAPPVQEDAALQASILPLTLVTAQSTQTPAPLVRATALPSDDTMMMAASVPPTPAPTPVPIYIIYAIQDGDTVDGLAARYGIAAESILWNNTDLEGPDTLALGQFLRIPTTDGIIYDVKLGDTLSDIADRYSVDVATITGFAGNHLVNADGIAEHQVIFVPNGTMPAPPPAPTPAPEQAGPSGSSPAPAAPSQPSEPSAPSSSGFIWPVNGPISSYFGPSHPLGIDIDQYNSPGAPIHAAAAGIVTFAGGDPCCSYGLYVVVNHQNGFETLYAHMASISVSQGEYVDQGEVIGYVGITGRSTGYHLHFEVHRNGAVVNPLDYLP
ncbi:MAG: M23 family metallopeptidase [Dehalococcoidia bacterium]|jgi:murein DD-endopeptidase MepM/ murein hydrolase activator NlpD